MDSLQPLAQHLAIIEEAVPSMRYDGKSDFSLWQSEARKKLAELLGMSRMKPCEPNFRLESETVRDGVTEYRFSFSPEERVKIPCVLLVPKEAKGKIPLYVCLQGHGKGMHISLGIAKFPGEEKSIESGRGLALQAVDRGAAALCFDQRCFGERGGKPQPDCGRAMLTALLVGRTIIGERVFDVSRAIDVVLENFPVIDSERILCVGNSGGGTTTYYTACIDTRISIAVPSCSVCTYLGSIGNQRHCECNYVPGIANYFEMGDLAGLIAPRLLVVAAGTEDRIFPIKPTRENFEIIKKYYKAAGASDNCRLAVGEGAHRFYPKETWEQVDALISVTH